MRWVLSLVVVLLPFTALAQSLDQAMRSVVSVLPQWPADARRLDEPEGSGVVVLDGQTIVTALHVVDKALSIRVRTLGGEIFSARLTGRDRATDIATLKINQTLPAIALADRELKLGEKVCAIGNSFGLGLSVSCGVVSGTHRAGVGFNRVEDFVQTDAAVNPGASGGALVTGQGKFAGLLSAIFTKTSDANIGINFAVSARLTNDVARQLRDSGRVKRTISGLKLEQVPAKGELGRLGARIVSLRPGLMGERAGLKAGDIILRAGGRRVRKPADFVSAMSALLGSDALEIEIDRGGATQKFYLKK
jgi:S1-C subfamily serine protease